jgi:hypothetical protein
MFSRDFKEFIKLLNSNNVKFMIVGGYAVALHGHPRYTKDLDVWITPEKDNALRLLKALGEFGFGSLDIKTEDFSVPDRVVQLGNPPNRIDLVTSATGLDFEECWKSRISAKIDDITISYINFENLKKNKKAMGRQDDLADLEKLKD